MKGKIMTKRAKRAFETMVKIIYFGNVRVSEFNS
jgi:hypothetical protein